MDSNDGKEAEVRTKRLVIRMKSASKAFTFIHLHLEYGNIVFPPSFQKDTDTLERVQPRARKSIRGLKFKRLQSLNFYLRGNT